MLEFECRFSGFRTEAIPESSVTNNSGIGGENIAVPRRPHRPNRSNKVNINKRIRAREVRVIDPDGEQIGIIPIKEALEAADDAGLDLVEVSPNAKPPV